LPVVVGMAVSKRVVHGFVFEFCCRYCESLSRVVKNRIRSVLRVQLKQLSGARSNLTEVVAKNLEAIFCFPFDDAWKEGNKWIVSDLMDSFRFSAEDANLCVEFLHKPHVQLFLKPLRSEKAFVETPISYVLGLVCKSLAISIQPSVMEAIRSNARQFDSRLQSIAYMDISLSTRVKHLPLIERCSAFILSQQGGEAVLGCLFLFCSRSGKQELQLKP
jgi:hypothetical protein